MKLIPLAYAILFSLFTAPTIALADPKKPAPIKKPVPAVAVVPQKPAEPQPLCGLAGKRTLTIPVEYTTAGAIYDVDRPGEGCGQTIILTGVYINLMDMSPAPDIDMKEADSGYLLIGGLSGPYELNARKAIDEDIVQRALSAAAKQQVYQSSVSRNYARLNDGQYWSHEYSYSRDAGGNIVPYKVCKTLRQGNNDPETCEFIYQDDQLGLSYRVGFKPNLLLDYNQVRVQALQIIDKMLHKA